MARLGFVGTGLMGSPMAQNLLRAGHEVMVYDVHPAATEQCAALGAQVARSASETTVCDLVFVIVKTGPQVEEVVLGEKGLLAGMRTGQELTCVARV